MHDRSWRQWDGMALIDESVLYIRYAVRAELIMQPDTAEGIGGGCGRLFSGRGARSVWPVLVGVASERPLLATDSPKHAPRTAEVRQGSDKNVPPRSEPIVPSPLTQ